MGSSGVAYVENDPTTGEPLMLRSADGVQALYVYDGMSSPVALIADDANSWDAAYDPYGAYVLTLVPYGPGGTTSGTVDDLTDSNPFGFKGGIRNHTNRWVHYGNLWYDSRIGRWTQQDTLDTPLDPGNANRYAYAGADPVNNVDPLGREIGLGCVAGTAAGLSLVALGVGELAGDVVSTAVLEAPSFGAATVAGGALAIGIAGEIAFGTFVAGASLEECLS